MNYKELLKGLKQELLYGYKNNRLNCGFIIDSFRFAKVWDIEDDMTSYADQTAFDAVWITSDTSKFRGNPATDVVDILNSNTYAVIYRDLTSVSDTAWIFRGKLVLTTAGSQSLGILYLLMSDNTGAANVADDHLGFLFYDQDNRTTLVHDDNRRPDQTLNEVNLSPAISPSATTYYVEMKRTSATSFTVTIYSDSTFTTSLGTATGTVSSSINTLRYFKMLGYNTANGLVGTFDNLQVMKTQSTPP